MGVRKVEGVSLTAISGTKAQICLYLMYNVDHSPKIWIIALHIYIFKIVANDMPWENRNLF